MGLFIDMLCWNTVRLTRCESGAYGNSISQYYKNCYKLMYYILSRSLNEALGLIESTYLNMLYLKRKKLVHEKPYDLPMIEEHKLPKALN